MNDIYADIASLSAEWDAAWPDPAALRVVQDKIDTLNHRLLAWSAAADVEHGRRCSGDVWARWRAT